MTRTSAKAIDRYVELRSDESAGSSAKIDTRLQNIIEGIFKRCIEDGEHKQVSIMLKCVVLLITQI